MIVWFWVLANIVVVTLLVLAITPRIPRVKLPEDLWLHVELGAAGQPVAVQDQFGRRLCGVTEIRYTAALDSIDEIRLVCFAHDERGYWIAGRQP